MFSNRIKLAKLAKNIVGLSYKITSPILNVLTVIQFQTNYMPKMHKWLNKINGIASNTNLNERIIIIIAFGCDSHWSLAIIYI